MVWNMRTSFLVAGAFCTATVLAADKEKVPVGPAVAPQKLVSPAAVGQRVSQSNVGKTQHVNPNLQLKNRVGGDDCATATVIPGIPYSDTGNTSAATDNYDEVCPFNTPGSPDVVYSYTPGSTVTVDISLCANTAYDSKLYVYENVCGAYQSGTFVACNDDFCSTPSYASAYVSAVQGVTLTGGNTYYIVVDGYFGASGDYTFDMTEAPPPPACPPGSLFGQNPSGTGDLWTAYTSELDAGGPGISYTVYDDFSGVIGQITDIHWWGIEAQFDFFGFIPCVEPNPVFDITFWTDSGGLPGIPVCTYTVTATQTATGLLYAGFPLTYYTVDPIAPFCTIPNGWVSIRGAGNSLCWFLWLTSGPGGLGSGLQDLGDGFGPQPIPDDLAYCLTGAYVPTFGACCDDSTGICTDNVELINCIGPGLRFAANTLCEELTPPCGQLPGACCYDDGTCAITTEAECGTTGGTWLGAFTSCDDCPIVCPPGGLQEPEPCGSDTDGGCNMASPQFVDINCGDLYCGSAWFDGGTRDTDWYRITVTEETELTWTVSVEFAALVGPVPTDPPGTGNCADLLGIVDPAAFPNAGETASVTICVGPGTYFFFVAPQFADLVDCPAGYIAQLTCAPCSVPRGACCLADGSCVDNVTASECGGLGGVYQGDGLTCGMVNCPLPPENDLCENAICLIDGVQVSGTNIGASGTDIDSCAFANTEDVWYEYTPAVSGMVSASTCGSAFDTTLSVFTACGGTEIACNDDSCGLQSVVSWPATAGVTYKIRFAGYNGAEGNFVLVVTGGGGTCGGEPEPGACCFDDGSCQVLLPADCFAQGGAFQGLNTDCDPNPCPQPLVNDECANAVCVEDGVAVVGTNVDATGSDITSCTFNDIYDVWYVYTPQVSGSVTIDTCLGGGSLGDTALAVFDECGGTELACNDDFCGLLSSVTVNMTAGEDYYIRVAGYNSGQGTFTLLVTGGQGNCITCGDLDGDGDVDVDDYNDFVDAFGSCIGDIKYRADADFDGDGCITLVDYQTWVACYRDANPNQPLPFKNGKLNGNGRPGGQQQQGGGMQQRPPRP
ncbi:MAG: hypothetical protein HRF50_07930 [Phycisphaerae bacterium]